MPTIADRINDFVLIMTSDFILIFCVCAKYLRSTIPCQHFFNFF